MRIDFETSSGFRLSWDLEKDRATVRREESLLWEGSLLPSFLLAERGETPRFCALKATARLSFVGAPGACWAFWSDDQSELKLVIRGIPAILAR